jgi:hypothetical protein
MDLLASLNMDELPEQQTRTMHLMAQHPDFDMALGFDACCTCGLKFTPSLPAVTCTACRRVKYCSDACRQLDADAPKPANVVADEEEETALGHTSIICALLKLCEDDFAIEDSADTDSLNAAAVNAAKDRIQSEFESYPATLANVIAQGPCFQDALKECASKSPKTLVLHVIGASEESEFWDTIRDENNVDIETVWSAYAEALSVVSSAHRFDTIQLHFVGPECPEVSLQSSKPIQAADKDGTIGDLVVRTTKGLYNTELLELNAIPKADIVVFFNPGLTVPEYNWIEALTCIEKGTPFLSTTNTELEGIADCQYLLDQDKIQSMPPGLADIFGLYTPGDEEDKPEDVNTGNAFFSENPFSGSRVRQSGTMANDLYVKNRWMLGGILDSFDPSKAEADTPSKRRRTTGSTNSKLGNPALI